jgi:hypothetical protein
MTFAHNDSFQTTYSPSQWSFTSDNGTELIYWDQNAFCRPWQPAGRTTPPSTATGKRRREDDTEADVDAFFSTIRADLEPNAVTSKAPAASSSRDDGTSTNKKSDEKSDDQTSQSGLDE